MPELSRIDDNLQWNENGVKNSHYIAIKFEKNKYIIFLLLISVKNIQCKICRSLNQEWYQIFCSTLTGFHLVWQLVRIWIINKKCFLGKFEFASSILGHFLWQRTTSYTNKNLLSIIWCISKMGFTANNKKVWLAILNFFVKGFLKNMIYFRDGHKVYK